MEMSARRSATLPGQPLCAGGIYGRPSPVSLCSLRGSPAGALDSDVFWSAQLCCVWPQDLEPTTNCPTITGTVTFFIQAPARPTCSSTTGCSCGCRVPSSGAVVTIASSAPTTNVGLDGNAVSMSSTVDRRL